jgi:hypothetical protein
MTDDVIMYPDCRDGLYVVTMGGPHDKLLKVITWLLDNKVEVYEADHPFPCAQIDIEKLHSVVNRPGSTFERNPFLFLKMERFDAYKLKLIF